MQFTDAVTVAGTRRRDDGYLVADARIARTGIQIYTGSEVGKPDMAIARLYRPEEEVFSRDTLASFAHRPVTNDHPTDKVTAENWKDVAVGQTSDEIIRDGTFIRVPLMVADAAAITDIEAGKRHLSAGYLADLHWEAGTTPNGEPYDAVQRNIRANHVAIVGRGRAGSEVRIGDGAASWGAAPITDADRKGPDMPDNLRKVMVDGLQVDTTDAGAQAIEKLTKDRDDARKATSDAETTHKEAIAAKDKELATKDAEIDDLKKKIVDGAALDKLVADRATLVNTAQAIAKDVKTEGLADADIRKAVVAAKLGDDAVKDKSAEYIAARFDILAEDAAKNASADPFASALKDGVRTQDGDKAVTDAYAKMVADMHSAHRPAAAS